MAGPISEAFVDIRPDFRNFESELAAGLRGGLGVMEAEAQDATENVEEEFREMVRAIERAFDGIDATEAFVAVDAAANLSAEQIERAFEEAGLQADEALGDIGGPGAFGPVVAEAQFAGERVEDAFSEASRSSNRSLSSIGLVAGGVFAGIVAAAAAAGAAIVGFGVFQAGQLEQTNIAFEGLLGSAEAAQSFIAEMQEFAKTTPFEFAGLSEAARQLLGVGFAAQDVIPTLSTIGDVAATLGVPQENIDGVITAIGQIRGLGKITADNLNQIANRLPGFNARQAISIGLQRELGITAEEAAAKLESGSVDAETGIRLLLTAMAEFPGAAGAMERQSQSLFGLFSTFKDTISLTLTDAVQPLIPFLKDVLAQATTLIGGALEAIAPAAVALAGDLGLALLSVLEAIGPGLGDILGGVSRAIRALSPLLDGLITSFGGALSTLAPLFESIVLALAPVFEVVSTLLNTLLPPLVTVFNGLVTALTPVLAALGGAFISILNALSPGLNALAEVIATVATAIGTLLAEAIIEMTPALVDLASAFSDLLVAVAPLIIGLVEAFLPVLVKIVEIIAGVLSARMDLITGLFEAFAEVVEILGPALLDVADALADALLEVLEELAPVLPELVQAFTDMALAFAEILVALAPVVVLIAEFAAWLITEIGAPTLVLIAEAIVLMAEGFAWLAEKLGEVVAWIRDELGPRLVDLWNNVIIPLGQWLDETFTPVWQALVDLWNGALAPALAQVAGVFRQIWNDILVPFWAFIQGDLVPAFQDLWAAIQPLIQAVGEVYSQFAFLWDLLRPFAEFLGGAMLLAVIVLAQSFAGTLVVGIGIAKAAVEQLRGVLGLIIGVFSGVIDMARQVGGVVGGFLRDQINLARGAWEALGGPIRAVQGFLEGVISAARRVAEAIRNIPSPPSFGFGLGPIKIGAKGGIFDEATALIAGEAGKEVLLPLTDPLRAMELAQESGLFGILGQAVRRTGVAPLGGGTELATGGDVINLNLYFAPNTTPEQADRLARSSVQAIEDERRRRRAQLEARIA